MTQEITVNWTVFSLTLAALFFFALAYAYMTRQMVIRKVEGQTAWMVVGGVTVVVVSQVLTFGLLIPALFMAAFAAAGLPMIFEYVTRVTDANRADIEKAKELAKEMLSNDGQTRDR